MIKPNQHSASKLSQLLLLIKSPSFIVLLISLLFLVGNLVITHRIRPYSSDDVSWQNILFTWHPFSGHIITLGSSDNFVDKLPFFMFFGHFLSATRRTILIEASITAGLGFTFFYIASLYFLKRTGLRLTYKVLLPFIWFASFGHSYSELLLNPIWRGFEIGFSFFVFMLFAMIYSRKIKPFKSTLSILVTVVCAAILAVLIFSDPYFLYFTIGPLLLFSGVLFLLKKINKATMASAYGILFISIILTKLVATLALKAGIQMATTPPTQFINFEQLGTNTLSTLHSVLFIFGADFFGRPPATLVVLSAFINILLVGVILYRIYTLCQKARPSQVGETSKSNLWMIFFACLSFLVLVVYTVSTIAGGIETSRYIIMMVLSSILLLSYSIGLMNKTRSSLMAVIIILAVIGNTGLALRSKEVLALPGAVGNDRNSLNFALIHAIQSRGLTKGYANYWQSGIDAYLSQNTVDFLPVYCPVGPAQEFHWLIDEGRFAQPAKQSFYIYDPAIPAEANCSIQQFVQQFGVPQSQFSLDGNTIMIYNYDITSLMVHP